MEIQDACLSQRSGQDLLIEFKQTRRQEPFEEIVRRYGGMVYGVCFQITRNRHDAEDATQAVFLALAMECKREREIKYLGPWLQQVAKRMSLDVKRSKSRREKRERNYNDSGNAPDSPPDGSHQLTREELNNILRDEVNQLPAKYRLPLILHYFGGMPQSEMAKELKCNSNTLSVRLFRGRDLLSKSLARRGITVAGAALAALLTETIRSTVSNSMTAATASAATQVAGGHGATIAIPAHLLALASGASVSPVWQTMKISFLVVVLVGSAIAGGPEAIRQIPNLIPDALHWDSMQLFKGLFKTVIPTPEFSDASQPESATPEASPTPAPLTYPVPTGPWVNGIPSAAPKTETSSREVARTSTPRAGVIQFAGPGLASRGASSESEAKGSASASAPQYKAPAPVQTARASSPPAASGRGSVQLSRAPAAGPGRAVVQEWIDPKRPPDSSGTRVFRSARKAEEKPQPLLIADTPATPKRLRDKKDRTVSIGPAERNSTRTTLDGSSIGNSSSLTDLDWYSGAYDLHTASNHVASMSIVNPNDAQLVLHEASDEGEADISALWRDDKTIPKFPPEHTLIEAWKVDENIDFASADLLVEYDDVQVMLLQKPEQYLKLWVYRDGWTRIMDSSFGRDMARNVLWGSTGDGFTYIAVSAPEPAGVLAVLMTTCALALRRRRAHPVPSPLGGVQTGDIGNRCSGTWVALVIVT